MGRKENLHLAATNIASYAKESFQIGSNIIKKIPHWFFAALLFVIIGIVYFKYADPVIQRRNEEYLINNNILIEIPHEYNLGHQIIPVKSDCTYGNLMETIISKINDRNIDKGKIEESNFIL